MISKFYKALTIGAVCESSDCLSSAIGSEVPMYYDFILEFGAGYGSLTKNLPEHTISYELHKDRHSKLRDKFPKRKIIHGDAIDILENLNKKAYIINSIPTILNAGIKNLKNAIKTAYEKGMIEQMVVYTYFPKNPYKGIFQKSKMQKIILRNLPPAYVWIYK